MADLNKLSFEDANSLWMAFDDWLSSKFLEESQSAVPLANEAFKEFWNKEIIPVLFEAEDGLSGVLLLDVYKYLRVCRAHIKRKKFSDSKLENVFLFMEQIIKNADEDLLHKYYSFDDDPKNAFLIQGLYAICHFEIFGELFANNWIEFAQL